MTVAGSFPEVELVQSFVFLFLVANVLADHGFIPAYRGHHVPSRPEVLTNEILLALAIDPGKTRGVHFFWDKSAGCLMTEQVATGVEKA